MLNRNPKDGSVFDISRILAVLLLMMTVFSAISCDRAMAYEVWPYHTEWVESTSPDAWNVYRDSYHLYLGDIFIGSTTYRSDNTYAQINNAPIPGKVWGIKFQRASDVYISTANSAPGSIYDYNNTVIRTVKINTGNYNDSSLSHFSMYFDPTCVEQFSYAAPWSHYKIKDSDGDGYAELLINPENQYSYTYLYFGRGSTAKTDVSILYDPPTFARGNTQAGAARTAAEAARIAAENTVGYAQTAATNASSAYSAASSANTNAANAYNAASSANTNAANAYNAASSANTAASGAKSNTEYGGNTTGYWSYMAYSKIVDSAAAPEISSVKGLNGATCTKSGSFTAIISAKNATQYRACVDSVGGTWGANSQITLSVSSGVHTIYVQAKNGASSVVDQETLTVFGL